MKSAYHGMRVADDGRGRDSIVPNGRTDGDIDQSFSRLLSYPVLYGQLELVDPLNQLNQTHTIREACGGA